MERQLLKVHVQRSKRGQRGRRAPGDEMAANRCENLQPDCSTSLNGKGRFPGEWRSLKDLTTDEWPKNRIAGQVSKVNQIRVEREACK